MTITSGEHVTAAFAPAPPSHTKISKAKINSKQHTASFSFSAHGASGYQCALLGPVAKGHKKAKPRFASCRSPKSYKHLKRGAYSFVVRGVNAAGADPRPASKTFTIA